MTKNNFTLKELMQEMRKEQKEQHDKLDAIYLQARLTNGRVTKLEDSSMGLLFLNNRYKVVSILISLFLFFWDTTREFASELIKKILGL